MKSIISLILKVFLISTYLSGQSPIGIWESYHPDKKTPLSHIEIYQSDEAYSARIVKIIDQDVVTRCDKCKGELENELLVGMIVLRDLKKKGNGKFKNGQIINPTNGKTYKCNLEVLTPDQLKIHAFVGHPLIGKSLFWNRVSDTEKLLAAGQ